ncbi:MAG: hypothetical protein WCG47_24815 [Dermatophilaceae bacterium]
MLQGGRGSGEGTWDGFVEQVQGAPGHLPVARRREVFEQTRSGRSEESVLGRFCTLIAERSSRVTPGEIAALECSGLSADEIFEAVVVAAVGAAQRRMDAALAAIEGC